LRSKVLLGGLLLAFFGMSLIAAVFLVPIKRQINIRTYEKTDLILHEIEDYDVNSLNYFVSVYIKRGRNVYMELVANSSFNLFVLPLEDWNSSISGGKEYSDLLVKYINASEVNAYFNSPEDGYYIFDVRNTNTDGVLRLESFRINAVWTDLVDNPSEMDYNYTFVVWGGILTVVGFSVALYKVLPRFTPQGVLKKIR
jgi:hypothetical protein